MRVDDPLEDLPEARPLYRVAPGWRLLAIVTSLAAAVLLLGVLVLGMVIVGLEGRPGQFAPAATVMAPPPVAWPVPPAPTANVPPDPTAQGLNLPYPVKADLAEGNSPLSSPDGQPARTPSGTARQRFLDLGTDLEKLPGTAVEEVRISPDGQRMAYVAHGQLFAGALGDAHAIVGTSDQPIAAPVMGYPGGGAVYYQPMIAAEETRSLGPPAWSADNHYVYVADDQGQLRRYDMLTQRPDGQSEFHVLPFGGASPTPAPGEPEKLIYVRSQPRPKLAVPGAAATPDFTEIVLYDASTLETQVLVPASPARWSHLVVSPDGKRLAMVSDRGQEGQAADRFRVFLLDLAGREPKPIAPPAAHVGTICWTADSQCLIYARSQEPTPADHWPEGLPEPWGRLDLYQWDGRTEREIRLSRGGGCFSPSLDDKEELFYLASQDKDSGLLLRRLPLAAARAFAGAGEQMLLHDAAAWNGLIEHVLAEAHLAAPFNDLELTPDLLAKLAATFAKEYRARFQAEPPTTLPGLALLRRELAAVQLPATASLGATLLVGALESDALLRQYGARWHWSKGPLLPSRPINLENPFAYAVHPFAGVHAWAERAGQQQPHEASAQDEETPAALLRHADGRTIVLTNDAAAAQTMLEERVDPALARGTALLTEGKPGEAETVFQELLKQKRQERNVYLALKIGHLLYEHQQGPALQRLMERLCEEPPHDARKYNLLGLALLPTEPEQAVEAFKKALRSDLRFEAGYLNLAQAYQLAKDTVSARLCLRRYLALMPRGRYAADAQQRLASGAKSGD